MAKKVIDIIPPKKPVEFKEEKELLPVPEKKANLFKKIIATILAILILVGILFHFALAKIEIIIWPKTEILNFKDSLTIDPKIEKSDFSKKIIPGKFFEEEKSATQQFPATGKVLKEAKAEGVIRVFNNYHLSQSLVANTRFQPPLEKILYFRTKKAITIPANSFLDVEVIADKPGSEYNISPSTFSIPGLAGLPQYYSIYGKSFSPMKGGFKGEVSQVTQEDLDGAKNILLEKLQKEGKDSLKAKISEEFIILDEAISQEIVESSGPEARTEAESFNLNLKIKSKAILFRKSNLEDFAKELIFSQIEKEKKFQKESLKINYSLAERAEDKISLNLDISVKIYSEIDEVLLKRSLLGKTFRESQILLENQAEIKKVQLKAFPFWIKKIPSEEEKIKIKLNID